MRDSIVSNKSKIKRAHKVIRVNRPAVAVGDSAIFSWSSVYFLADFFISFVFSPVRLIK